MNEHLEKMSLNEAIDVARKYAEDIAIFDSVDKYAVSKVCEVLLLELQAYKDKEDKINSSELMEVLADIEHKRWSGWQEYLHSLCVKNEDGSLTIPKERVDWWNKEIETPYCDLEERLKEYDRDEVRKTLSAILQILNDKVVE